MAEMYRLVPLLAMCSGCDAVFGLDVAGDAGGDAVALAHDEDADGVDDALDGCPHIAGTTPDDEDRDGIPVACDDDDRLASTGTLYSFAPGLAGVTPLQGTLTPEDDAIVLGDGDVTVIALDRMPTTALVEVGFEVISNQVEDGLRDQPWAEVGVHTIVRSPAANEFGNACYYGRRSGAEPSGYLDAYEDTEALGSAVPTSAVFTGQAGRLRIVRDPTRVDCQASLADGSVVASSGNVRALGAVAGAVGVSAGHARIRIRYVWISAAP